MSATISAASVIKGAEFFLDATGANGQGTPLSASDGAFNSTTEGVTKAIPKAVFTSLSQGTHTIFIHGKNASGVWGNFATITFTKDTLAPAAPSVSDLIAASDSGSSDQDNLTAVTTPTLAGTAEAGATVKLFDRNVAVGTTTADASGAWSFTVPTALADGTHTFTAKAVDGAGNTSAASPALTVKIDTHAPSASTPDLLASSDSGLSSTDNITTDSTPTFKGTAETGSTVLLFSDGVQVGSGTAAAGSYSITADALAEGSHSLTAKAVDAAGNTSALSTALNITIDTTAPNPPSTPDLSASSDSGASSTDNLTNVRTPAFLGLTEAGSTVQLLVDGSLVRSASARFGIYSLASTSLSDGIHTVTVRAIDAAGNVASSIDSLQVTIDATAPGAPTGLSLADGSDSGTVGDNITNVTRPTVQGTAEAGATVKLLDGTRLLGTTTADSGGAWSVVPVNPLSAGSHTLTARATDAAGNTGVASTALVVVINPTTVDAPSRPDLVAAGDSGASTTDNVTNLVRPTFTGTAQAQTIIELFDGTTSLGTTTTNSSGQWSFTSPVDLAEGDHTITATARLGGGSPSPASLALLLTIDITAPEVSPADLDPASDTGIDQGDAITSITTPTFTGTAEAGSGVQLTLDDTIVLGTATADDSGSWAFTMTDGSVWADGDHSITVTATDLAGNSSTPFAPLLLTLDTTTPTAPSSPTLAGESDSGTTGDDLTNISAPTLTGTAEADSTVAVYDGANLLGTTTAEDDGSWAFDVVDPLADGPHAITVTATDAAGNVSDPSGALVLTIDTIAPSSGELILDPGSDSGETGDGLTNVNTPFIIGAEEPGTTITLYLDDTELGVPDEGWVFLITSPLPDGDYLITAAVTDAAGNTHVDSLAVTIDTQAPDVFAPVLDPADDSGTPDDNITNVAAPTLTGTAEAGSSITIYDSVSSLGSAVADEDGNWTFTPSSPLAEGEHGLSATATDAADNTSVATDALLLTIDTTAPGVSTPALDPFSDDGDAGDNVTSVTTPTFTGTAEADNTVTLFDNGTSLGTTAADGDGNWSFDVIDPLTNGGHSITATATDAAGNTSAPSSGLALTIQTEAVAPDAPTLALDSNSDSGTVGDNITNVAPLGFAGTAAAGSTVTLYLESFPLGTAETDGTGHWSFVMAGPLLDGIYTLSASAAVADGPSSGLTYLNFKVDTQAPTLISAQLDPASDSGVDSSDGITNVTQPVFIGQTEAGSTLTLFDTGAVELGTTVADANGDWTFTPTSPLSDGVHTISISAVDVAGNTLLATPALEVTIDTALPAVSIPTLDPASDSGVLGDGKTSVTTPLFTGTAEAGSTVTLYVDDAPVGTVVAGPDGAWSISPAALDQNDHSIRAAASDAAGNTSTSSSVNISIDSNAPVAVILGFAPGSDSGAEGDTYTNVTTPTLTGLAVPGSEVPLFDHDIYQASATADSTGHWTYTPSGPLAEELHQFLATSPDGDQPSNIFSFLVDATAPEAPPMPGTTPDSDPTTPTLAGTAEAFSTVTVFDGAESLGTALADPQGNWNFVSPIALTPGIHEITVTATDLAGNTSDPSPALELTVESPSLPGPRDYQYNWTPSALQLYSTTSSSSFITLTDEPGRTVRAASTNVIATNLRVTSDALPGFADEFQQVAWTLQVSVKDLPSGVSGTFTFTGYFSGTVSSESADITSTVTSADTQHQNIGEHSYTLRILGFTPPGPPDSSNAGAIAVHISG